MQADNHQQGPKTPKTPDDYTRDMARKAARRLRGGRPESLMFWLGMFGLVGWSVAIPTLAGAAIGLWLDNRWPATVSWTLTCLFIGLGIGCVNAWYWVRQEREPPGSSEDEDSKTRSDPGSDQTGQHRKPLP